MSLSFFVPGKPVQQGSKRSLGPGRPFVEDNKEELMPWRDSIIYAARQAWGGSGWEPDDWLFPGPVRVDLVFAYRWRKSDYGTGRNAAQLKDTASLWKVSAPDVDKLARAALDAFTIAGIWRNDAQVADLHAVKQYAHTPGMAVTIETAAPMLPEPRPVEAEAVLL